MAHCMRRPILSAASFTQSIRLHERAFSQVFAQCNRRVQEGQQPRQPAERSIRIAAKDFNQMPTDLGILPQTFITPSGANRPSLFSTPRDLFKLQLQRIKRKSSDALMMGIYWFSHRKSGLKIRFRQTAPTAVALHRQMYTAFAEGDVKTLRRICCEGLNDSFAARIHGRGKEKVQWELVKYNKRPRVMSNKAASLPRDGCGIRQAVVRISSRQRLTRYGANGKIIPGSGKEKDVVEYVVIQKILLNGQEGEWQVWGTTGESTLEQIEEENKAALI